jgi:membrane-bound serine protease (ClpP class)
VGALLAALLVSLAADGEAPPQANWADKIVVIEIEGTLMPSLFGSGGIEKDVKEIFEHVRRDRPRHVIVEVNSLGGAVLTCKAIADTILDSPVPTTALVLEDAISGGAMIAVGCDTIEMLDGSRIGDVQPMTMTGEGMDERTAEKSETYVRGVMSAAADANGHPKALLNAMVSRDIELYRVTFADGSDAFLTLGEMELLEEEIEAGRDEREIVRKELIAEEGKLLTLTAQEALAYGLAAGVHASRDAFLAARDFPRADLVYPAVATGRTMAVWTQLLVAVFLVIGITGAFAEMSMPGFGIPGACGIIGFAGFFLILFFHGRADWISLTLFFLGIALLVVEIAVIPGFGVAGGLGILLLLAGLVLAILPGLESPEWEYHWYEELSNVVLIFGASLVGVILLLWLGVTVGSRVPGVNQFFLRESLRSGRDVLADALVPGGGEQAADPDEMEPPDPRAHLRGKTAVATTTLRPAGKARLEETGELLDVVAQYGMIEEKARVVVLDTSMNRIVVAPLADPAAGASGQA